jgi:hypothetical protein
MAKWNRSKSFYLILFVVLLLACNVASPSGQVATGVAATLTAAQAATGTAAQAATDAAAQIETAIAGTSTGQVATIAVDQAVALTLTDLAPVPTAGGDAAPESTPTAQVIVITQPPQPTNAQPPASPTQIQPPESPTPTMQPTLEPFTAHASVYENQSEQPAGFGLMPGDSYSIQATGQIWAGVAFTGENGPEGWANTDCDKKFPLPCAHPFSLLMRYYDSGPWIEVGRVYQGSYNGLDDTQMVFRINDDVPGNGSGYFNVYVTVVRMQPAP